ncbi:MAG: TetR/AcrR family transcriptional regulator [Rubrivivax sp.]
MARPRAATYDEQREAILARAAELFARQGYTATTMNQVAAACGVTKPTLYHYFADKQSLLMHIAAGHVARLEALAAEVDAQGQAPAVRLRALIERFMRAYADAQHQHRVLTEDVRFLPDAERHQVLAAERRVVAAFADAVAAVRPELRTRQLHKPLTMLLFGMMNWTFTWLRPDGALSYDALGAIVADLFGGGLQALPVPAPRRAARGPLRQRG